MWDLIIAILPLLILAVLAVGMIAYGSRAKPHKHLTESSFGIAGSTPGGPKGDPFKEIEEAAEGLDIRLPKRPY
jgi:hypothetical protein